MKQRLHPIELTLMIVAALALTSGAVALHTQSQLAEKVVRLHVLANSDSEEDQAQKLRVRDAVLDCVGTLTADCKDAAAAQEKTCVRSATPATASSCRTALILTQDACRTRRRTPSARRSCTLTTAAI